MSAQRPGVALGRTWVVPVALAAAATCLTARHLPAVLALLAVAAVPWVAGALGRPLPAWLFGALGIAPVAGVLVLEGLDASVFLGTTTLCELASRSDRRRHLAVVTAVGVALPLASCVHVHPYDPGAVYFAIGDLLGIVLGLLLGRTRRLDAQLRAADARLVAASAQEERTRLARDVHDLVAHSMTVVVLQVGGARRVLRGDPAAAEAALVQAERVCRESLDGIRGVVGLLRAQGEPAGEPLDLDRLVGTYRAAGVALELSADGDVAAVPLLVRGTLHRVVQEALANAARYRAPGTTVSVRVDAGPEVVTACVANAAPDAPARRSGAGGYGLRGLREQVAAVGGTLRSGPASGGRWLVECRLPRGAVTAPTALAITEPR